jgi:hypothetical protein
MQSNGNRVGHSNHLNADPDEIAALERRLAIHRRNLYELEEQKARHGLNVPLRIINEIAEQEKAIAQIEARLTELSVSVAIKVDHGITESNGTDGEPQDSQQLLMDSVPKKLWLPRVWWVPIIVALIGLIGVIITSIGVTPSPTDTSFDYQVRVQERDTGEYILNAEVTIEVSGKAPLDGITDSNGLARIFISSSHAGKPGMLIVEATGYKRHTQNIDLTVGTLPDVVQLEPAP